MSTEPTEPTSEAAFFTTIRSWKIVRTEPRVFGGVLSGVGARIGLAPVPARLIFVLLALVTGGLALLAYAAAWALLPDADGRIIIQDFGRGTPNVGSLVAIGVIAFIGFFTLDNWGIFNWGNWWNIDAFPDMPGMGNALPRLIALVAILVPLAIIGGIVFAIVWSVRYGKSQNPGAQGYARLPDGTIPEGPAPATPAATPEASERTATDTAQTAPAEATAVNPADSAPVGAVAATAVLAAPATAPAPAYTPPAYSPPVYTAPATTYTPKPRVPGPGKFGYLAALALIPISIAVTLYLSSTDQLGVFPWIAAGVIWVAGLGLILVINALRGRKAGFLGFVSFVALIPIGLTIAAAPQMREYYAEGGWWGWNWVDDGSYHGWNWGNGPVEGAPAPVEPPAPEPAFDPSGAFLDYESVAINGACYKDADAVTPDVSGTVRLSDVAADQTITVTSPDTLLSIPKGTSLKVVNMGGTDGMASAFVSWDDRDLGCELTSVGSPGVQLTNAGAPVLTVLLDDTMTMGYMSLWIEEN